MHVTFSPEELAFREEVRAFFRDEMPDDIRQLRESGAELRPEAQVRWQQLLHKKGWAGVNWPVEHGGTGWTPVQKYIFATEEANANAPVIVPFGLSMVGPVPAPISMVTITSSTAPRPGPPLANSQTGSFASSERIRMSRGVRRALASCSSI